MINLPQNVIFALHLLENAGFQAFAVGGAVRDQLLGAEVTDFDITTSALPEETKIVFSDYKVIETGIKHGTVTVLINDSPVEITTYRVDGEYTDNRHPENVVFTSKIEDDLSRRDFTVNAIAYNPRIGIVDPFGGIQDLNNNILRAVGNPEKRFREDALRILRLVRFASVLGFDVEQETKDNAKKYAHLLENVSAERVFSELKKLICGRNVGKVMEEFPEIITQVIPELSASVGFSQKSKYHVYDVYTHTLKALEVSENHLLIRLSLLFHDCGKPYVCTEDENGARHFKGHEIVSEKMAREALLRLKCDNKTLKTITRLVLYHDYKVIPEKASVNKFLSLVSYDEARLIAKIRYADMFSHAPQFRFESDYAEKIIALVDESERNGECVNLKTLDIDGNDLLSCGINSGSSVGDVLQSLLSLVLAGEIPNEKSALIQKVKEEFVN